jgi:hypothetical protein
MPLAYLDNTDRSYVVPLNATLSSIILNHVAAGGRAKIFKTFIDLGNALAPHVNRGAIRRRSPEARLAGRLFDYDQIVRHFLGDLAPSFYEETRQLWQWNSRYWDQVALLNLARFYAAPSTELGKDALVQAVQHARHAVSIEIHPYSLTTLGTILLAQLAPDAAWNTEIYNEAFERLAEAIDREKHWSHRNPHSFVSLFAGTKRYIENGGNLTSIQRDRLDRVVTEAQKLFPRDLELGGLIAQLSASLRN